MPFCHLHVHTEHSLLDGVGKSIDWIKKAKQLGQAHLALTNHANIDGIIQFQNIARKEGIKPILGCELYIVPNMFDKKNKTRFHITALIKNETGFQNLCKMLSLANLKGFYYKPRVDYQTILDNCEGLIFLSGCSKTALMDEKGGEFLNDLYKKINDNFYYEVQPHNFKEQKDINQYIITWFNDGNIVATNDCHYINEEDDILQEVLLAIQTKAKWNDSDRFKFKIKGLHLKSEKEMYKAFLKQGILNEDQIETAINNTMEIAKKCENFEIKKKDIWLPAVKGIKDEEGRLEFLCKKGYEKIFNSSFWQNSYKERFIEEFELIKKKDFVRYFLLVHELIEWCKANDIMIGPGRGSVGGSLIAYLIGITTIDPVKYNLLFSRFIDEGRNDLPDIDIDFQDDKRHFIREHLEELYGKNNISSVSTFMKMKGRGVIRDVSRVFDVPLKEVDVFAKAIIDDGDDSIQTAISNTKEGEYFQRKYPQVVDLAIKLEGQIRGCSQHAAAIIVSAEDLTQGTRGNIAMRSNLEVINWDKDDAEFLGLMKLDVLGLNTLTVLSNTKKLIKQNHDKEINFEKIQPNNQQIFEMLSKGETVGVFQFSTWPMTKLAKEIKISNFNDMVAAIALVRPGPADSGMTNDYIARKHGKKWQKKHKIYEEITRDTFGLIVYQEQIMQVISKVAGLSYSIADKIRKIVSKQRNVKEFEQYKDIFIAGCKEQETLSEKEANEFWATLEKHARYSFNLAHSTEYAMIGYWTAFCKLYYPAEFICANLTYGVERQKEKLVEEAERLGLEVVLPKVGVSNASKWIVKDKKLYVPFIEIKGVGEKTAENFVSYKSNNNHTKSNKQIGFFSLKNEIEIPEKIISTEKILRDIGAFGEEPTGDLDYYFSFKVTQTKEVKYPNLKKINDIISINKLLSLDIEKNQLKGMIQENRYQNPKVLYCEDCELRKECKRPVMSSKGIYNMMICGEAPGCISGDSLIDTAFRDKSKFPNGIPIRDLVGKEDIFVYSFDIENQKMVIAKAKKIWRTGVKKVWRITYEWWFNTPSGRILKTDSIKVSSNHKFLLKKWQHKNPFKGINKKNDRDYLSIDEGLSIGHSLQPFYRTIGEYCDIGVKSDQKIRENRFLLEYKLNRKLKNKKEQCHHIDENKLNDNWDNLKFNMIDEHSRHHTSKNNPMHNLIHKQKHQSIVQSIEYKNKMSIKMKEILKDSVLHQNRLKQICDTNPQRRITVKNKHKNDPIYRYNYLMGLLKRKNTKNTLKEIRAKFKLDFPNESFPPVDNHKIMSIEYCGEEEVFDMEIEKYDNFAVNGIFVHNSKENEEGKGFIGKSGDLLWSSLNKHDLSRRMFHVTNCVKCWPSETKTPNSEHIKLCSQWLDDEIKNLKPKLCLALGNIALKYFKNEDGGIMKLCGTTEWIEEKKIWVSWGLHPSAVLRNPKNKELFENGIKNFADKINLLGGV